MVDQLDTPVRTRRGQVGVFAVGVVAMPATHRLFRERPDPVDERALYVVQKYRRTMRRVNRSRRVSLAGSGEDSRPYERTVNRMRKAQMRRSPLLLLVALPLAVLAVDAWHTPVRGAAERTEVMDALRTHMRRFDPQPQVFMVHELCLGPTRGWLAVDPRSPDGNNHYERIHAVMLRRDGLWEVEDIACGEAECAAGTDPEALREKVAPRCG